MRHFGRVVVRHAVGAMMKIMEFANRGITALQHIDIELSRNGLYVRRRQLRNETIHRLPPGPEIVSAGSRRFGEPGDRPLKSMGVQVRHAGQHRPGSPLEIIAAFYRAYIGDQSIRIEDNGHIACPTTGQKQLFAIESF